MATKKPGPEAEIHAQLRELTGKIRQLRQELRECLRDHPTESVNDRRRAKPRASKKR